MPCKKKFRIIRYNRCHECPQVTYWKYNFSYFDLSWPESFAPTLRNIFFRSFLSNLRVFWQDGANSRYQTIFSIIFSFMMLIIYLIYSHINSFLWYEQCRYPEIWSKVVKESIFKAFVTLYEFPQDDRQFECRVLMVWSQVLDVKRGVPATVCPLVKKTIVLDHIWS